MGQVAFACCDAVSGEKLGLRRRMSSLILTSPKSSFGASFLKMAFSYLVSPLPPPSSLVSPLLSFPPRLLSLVASPSSPPQTILSAIAPIQRNAEEQYLCRSQTDKGRLANDSDA